MQLSRTIRCPLTHRGLNARNGAIQPAAAGAALLVAAGAAICAWTLHLTAAAIPDLPRPLPTVASSPANDVFSVTINRPSGPPRVLTGIHDAQGNPVTVSCATCHATRPPHGENRAAKDLDEFHQGMSVVHGNLACLSCHNPDDYDALKLADGTRIEYSDVMQMCAQCHSQQMDDFLHGAHGGMNGFWDPGRGPRSRKNCVECHAPHDPRFPRMIPDFMPRDRFTDSQH